MNTDLNRVIQKLCGAAICAALLTSTAIAREKANPLGSARQLKTDVAGLDAPAEILVDRWGIPHIYAANAARRLLRCRASTPRATGSGRSTSGASAGWAGSPAISAPPTSSRTAPRACSSTAATWTRSGRPTAPRRRPSPSAFVAGINAYVADVAPAAGPLPVGVQPIAGTRRRPGRPEDVVRIRSHGLTRNVASEVARAQVACAAGLDADRVRSQVRAGVATTMSPPASTPARAGRRARRTTSSAPRPVAFAGTRPAAALRRSPSTCARRGRPAARHRRLQQLGGRAVAHGHRPADPGQRSAPRPSACRRCATSSHLNAPGPRRDRRRRAGPAGHLHRPQRHHRLRPDHLQHRPGRPLRLRAQSRATRPVPLPATAGRT